MESRESQIAETAEEMAVKKQKVERKVTVFAESSQILYVYTHTYTYTYVNYIYTLIMYMYIYPVDPAVPS